MTKFRSVMATREWEGRTKRVSRVEQGKTSDLHDENPRKKTHNISEISGDFPKSRKEFTTYRWAPGFSKSNLGRKSLFLRWRFRRKEDSYQKFYSSHVFLSFPFFFLKNYYYFFIFNFGRSLQAGPRVHECHSKSAVIWKTSCITIIMIIILSILENSKLHFFFLR